MHKVRLWHVVDEQVEVAQDSLVGHDADHVARHAVNDWQAVHLVCAEHADRLEQRVLGTKVDERASVLFEDLAPCLQLVLF